MKLLKEPLLHFVAGGAVLFAAYAWLDRDGADVDAKEPIRITEGDVQWLVDNWSKQWLRAPSPEEIARMVVDLTEEELLAREAVETGLDKDDTVVRRRLAQKLKFLVEDTSHVLEPTEGELASYHAAHPERFQAGPTVSFVQVFFNPEHRADAAADAKTSLVALQRDGGENLAGTIGDRFLIESRFDDLDRTAVSGIFGPEFADAVFALKQGEWSGPISRGTGSTSSTFLYHAGETTPPQRGSRRGAGGLAARERGDRLPGILERAPRQVWHRDGRWCARPHSGRGRHRRGEKPMSRLIRAALAWKLLRCAALTLVAIVGAGAPAPAMAHEVRPSYLQIEEAGPATFDILFKTPMMGDAQLALSPLFSGKVKITAPMVSRPTGDAMIQTWRIRAIDPLAGQTVRIDGLESTLTDALVRVEFADGYVWVERLTPRAPAATIRPCRPGWSWRRSMSARASSTSSSASTICSSSPR